MRFARGFFMTSIWEFPKIGDHTGLIWEFPKIRGSLFWGPHKDPTT